MLDTVCVRADVTCECILEYSEIARGISGQFSGNISIGGLPTGSGKSITSRTIPDLMSVTSVGVSNYSVEVDEEFEVEFFIFYNTTQVHRCVLKVYPMSVESVFASYQSWLTRTLCEDSENNLTYLSFYVRSGNVYFDYADSNGHSPLEYQITSKEVDPSGYGVNFNAYNLILYRIWV